MKAVRLHRYHQDPVIEDVPEPQINGPWDVIVDVGAAGLCRTDLHVMEGQWQPLQKPELPYILGHENSGWVREVGSAVTTVSPGDTVIMHPLTSCGLCPACRVGEDSHCENATFPGLNVASRMAEQLLTNARAVAKSARGTDPTDVASLAAAGRTAYHAVRNGAGRRRAVAYRHPDTQGTYGRRNHRHRPRRRSPGCCKENWCPSYSPGRSICRPRRRHQTNLGHNKRWSAHCLRLCR